MLGSPFEFEQHLAYKRDTLLHEAAAERLAGQIEAPSNGARLRIAAAIYALAAWLDPIGTPPFLCEADCPTAAFTT